MRFINYYSKKRRYEPIAKCFIQPAVSSGNPIFLPKHFNGAQILSLSIYTDEHFKWYAKRSVLNGYRSRT